MMSIYDHNHNLDKILDSIIAQYEPDHYNLGHSARNKIRILDTNINDAIKIPFLRKIFSQISQCDIEILLHNPFYSLTRLDKNETSIHQLNAGLFKIRKALNQELSMEAFQNFGSQEIAIEQLYDIAERSKSIGANITIKFHAFIPAVSCCFILNNLIFQFFTFSKGNIGSQARPTLVVNRNPVDSNTKETTNNYAIWDQIEDHFNNTWNNYSLPIIGNNKYFSKDQYPELFFLKHAEVPQKIMFDLVIRLRNYLAINKIEIVLEALLYLFFSIKRDTRHSQTILIISSRYYRNKANLSDLLISNEDFNIEENRIMVGLFEILEYMENLK